MTGLAPIHNRFFDQPGLGVMLREELGLAFYDLWGMGFERFGDLRMQLLPGIAQQAAVRRVLHQRVLEAVDRVGRRAALKDQLGSDELGQCGAQFILGKSGDGMQHRIRKLASNRRADLRYLPRRREAVEPRQQRGVQGCGIASGGNGRSST